MKKLLVTLAALLVSVSAFAQATDGTITFHNRNLATPNPDGQVNVPINGVRDPAATRAQLFLVSGTGASTVYTPLSPLQVFRPSPAQQYFTGAVTVNVTGQAPGTTGLRFVVRAWEGAEGGFDSAGYKGQSAEILPAALGGINQAGTIFFTPDLGGANGLRTFELVPEPSTIALGVLGAAALLYRRRK
jgi:hypothetical protein